MNDSKIQWLRQFPRRVGLGIVFVWWSSRFASAALPGELFEYPIADQKPAPAIRLRYCPPGTIYPGRPNPDRNSSSLSLPSIKVSAFYMGETEVTLAQFRGVLGEAGLNAPKTEAAKFQVSNPQLFSLMKSGENEPVFFVGLPEAIGFCVALQSKIDRERTEQSNATIETRQVRLPTHVEWQYAARAINNADQQSQRPHFNREFRLADLTPANQEKCREVWAKLGRSDQFVGSQDQMLALTSVTSANEKSKVRDILAELHHQLIGGPARSSANGIGTVPWDHGTQPSDLPNAWNIYDIHDNVTEWVIWASSNERREELWNSMVTKVAEKQSFNGQTSVFLAGGFFSDSVQNLAHFTIWGGPKVPDGTGTPQEFEFQSDLVSEFSPGFRILMERTIAQDWLFTLRRGLYNQDQWSASSERSLNDSLQLLTELADTRHPGFRTIEFYRVLHALNQNSKTDSADFFMQLAQVPQDVSQPKKPSLAELLGDASTDKPDKPESSAAQDDSQLFWKSFASLHGSH